MTAELADAAAELAMRAAEAIIRARAQVDRGMVVRAIEEALEHLLGHVRCEVRVNPLDAEAVRAFARQLSRGPDLEVVEDEGVEPGGAVITADAGEVDASISGQLERLRRRVLGQE